MAAEAVSTACTPVEVPVDVAVESSAPHDTPVFTQLARILAKVLVLVCGAIPLPVAVAARARPVERVSRLATVAAALTTPIRARLVPELDTCVASVAKPESPYAVAMVDTSLMETERVLLGQFPIDASSPDEGFMPEPASPPDAYR